MPSSAKTAPVASTANFRHAAGSAPAHRRSWLYQFFIAPFTDINHELAERMRANANARTVRRVVRR